MGINKNPLLHTAQHVLVLWREHYTLNLETSGMEGNERRDGTRRDAHTRDTERPAGMVQLRSVCREKSPHGRKRHCTLYRCPGRPHCGAARCLRTVCVPCEQTIREPWHQEKLRLHHLHRNFGAEACPGKLSCVLVQPPKAGRPLALRPQCAI